MSLGYYRRMLVILQKPEHHVRTYISEVPCHVKMGRAKTRMASSVPGKTCR